MSVFNAEFVFAWHGWFPPRCRPALGDKLLLIPPPPLLRAMQVNQAFEMVVIYSFLWGQPIIIIFTLDYRLVSLVL